MPYDATGTYIQIPGATTAQAGDVIRSATWDNIFTDIGNCLTTVGQRIIQTPRYVTVAGTLQVTAVDSLVVIQASAPIINIPSCTTRTAPITIVGGAAGIFGTNNSVVTPVGGETISGLASVTLTGNYQSITLFPLSSGGYLIV